jgi:hypothetical protein
VKWDKRTQRLRPFLSPRPVVALPRQECAAFAGFVKFWIALLILCSQNALLAKYNVRAIDVGVATI